MSTATPMIRSVFSKARQLSVCSPAVVRRDDRALDTRRPSSEGGRFWAQVRYSYMYRNRKNAGAGANAIASATLLHAHCCLAVDVPFPVATKCCRPDVIPRVSSTSLTKGRFFPERVGPLTNNRPDKSALRYDTSRKWHVYRFKLQAPSSKLPSSQAPKLQAPAFANLRALCLTHVSPPKFGCLLSRVPPARTGYDR